MEESALAGLVIIAGMVLVGIIGGCRNKSIEPIIIDDSMITILDHNAIWAEAHKDSVLWDNSIYNPDNQPYVLEVAFNLGIPIDSVSQAQFNERYIK